MRKTKRQLPNFAFYDQKAIESHLEKMAAEGWMLEKVGNYFWTYGQMEAKQVHVAVTYVAGASNFDSGPTAGELDLEELAARDGWVKQLSWGQMQIFYNERPDPVPLETDPATQMENIRRAMRKSILPAQLLAVGMGLYFGVFWGYQLWRDPVDFLSSPLSLGSVLMGLLLFFTALWEALIYLNWFRRAKKAVEQGEMVSAGSHRIFSWIRVLLPFMLLLFVFRGKYGALLLGSLPTLLVILLTAPLLRWIKSLGRSRRFNLIASIGAVAGMSLVGISLLCVFVFWHPGFVDGHKPVGKYEILPGAEISYYQDELPLRVEDLVETDADVFWSTEKTEQASLLVERMECRQHDLNSEKKRVPNLEYAVTQVKLPVLYSFCRDGLLRQREDVVQDGEVVYVSHYEAVDATPWGAKEAYQLYLEGGFIEEYILCYPNVLVELDLDEAPTAEQIGTIRAKLDLP